MKQVFVLIFFSFFVFLQPAQAQDVGVLESYRVDMPNVEPLSADVLSEKAELFQSVPFNDAAMGYKIFVPKEWTNSTLAGVDSKVMSRKVLGEVARFYSQPRISARSYLTVEAIRKEYEMATEHWVLRYLLSNGYTSQGMRRIDRDRVEFFYVDVDGDTTYGIRAVAQANGARVLLAQYHLPIEVWEEEKSMQASVLNSFNILTPVQEDVEKMMEYRFLDVAGIKYPDSWSLKAPPIKTIDRMNIRILNFNNNATQYNLTLDGRIDVFLVNYYAVENVGEEITAIRDKIVGNTLSLGKILNPDEHVLAAFFEDNEDIDSYDLKIWTGQSYKKPLINYELWISTIETGDYFYFFTLLTPSREDDFFVWSRNKETYDLIIKSFEPNLEFVIE